MNRFDVMRQLRNMEADRVRSRVRLVGEILVVWILAAALGWMAGKAYNEWTRDGVLILVPHEQEDEREEIVT